MVVVYHKTLQETHNSTNAPTHKQCHHFDTDFPVTGTMDLDMVAVIATAIGTDTTTEDDAIPDALGPFAAQDAMTMTTIFTHTVGTDTVVGKYK